ncbi:hypothetical protein M9435_006096 [Picochlorum sp. BPE23]|nr:hypothetical protein M9435_006096 [Picochlorum sp. BPE23]
MKHWKEFLIKDPGNRGFIQAYVGAFVYLCIVSNPTVWNALSYDTTNVGPVTGFIGFALALQTDSGASLLYVSVRLLGTICGGSLGLGVMYLAYLCNGHSFQQSVTKGATLVLFVTLVLSVTTYFYRGPVWSPKYKAVLISGIMFVLVSTSGTHLDQIYPKTLAYIVLNMLIGLFVSTIASHAVFPIHKSEEVVGMTIASLRMLSQGTDALTGHLIGADVMLDDAHIVERITEDCILPVGTNVIKSRMLLRSSAMADVSCTCPPTSFPVKYYSALVACLRQYISLFGTLINLVENQNVLGIPIVLVHSKPLLRHLVEQMKVSFDTMIQILEGTCTYEEGIACVKELEERMLPLVDCVHRPVVEMTVMDSRSVLLAYCVLGLRVCQMFSIIPHILSWQDSSKSHYIAMGMEHFEKHHNPVIKSFSSYRRVSGGKSKVPGYVASMKRSGTLNTAVLRETFKNHRGNACALGLRRLIHALGLRPRYLKPVAQQAIAISAAMTLHVCDRTYNAFQGHTMWILVTVWIMGGQGTVGATVLKACNRIVGTVAAGCASYIIIYLVYLLNGLSYQNRALKYIFMTLIYPFFTACFHRGMLKSPRQFQYAWYVMKLTLPIAVLSGYIEEVPSPDTAAWRILCILVGIGLEFVATTLVFYRESVKTARHEIQRICKGLSYLSFESSFLLHQKEVATKDDFSYVPAHQYGIEVAALTVDLDRFENLMAFEDQLAALARLDGVLFERDVIDVPKMKRLRICLRKMLNRILSLCYIHDSISMLNIEPGMLEFQKDFNTILQITVPRCLSNFSRLIVPMNTFYQGEICNTGILILHDQVENLKDKILDSVRDNGVVSYTMAIACVNILFSLCLNMMDFMSILQPESNPADSFC